LPENIRSGKYPTRRSRIHPPVLNLIKTIDHLSLAGNPIPSRNRPSFDSGFSSIVQPPPRGITNPLIEQPSFFLRKFHHPTWLPFIRFRLPLSLRRRPYQKNKL